MDKKISRLKKIIGDNLLAILKKGRKTVVLVNDTLIPNDEELQYHINISKKVKTETIFLGDLWDELNKGKTEILNLIVSSKKLYDKGYYNILKSVKKLSDSVVDKFGEHIICSVLYGSAVIGKTETDIDIAFVVDDTDLNKISRNEAREKLSAIINSIARSIKSKYMFHIQVYMLSAFWESIRDAHPVIFTLIRDGIPFYDIGLFKPWKMLLKMGKVKPTVEAIDNFLLSAEIFIKKLKDRITDMTIDDLWYVMINPAQAALMMYGLAPSNPRETISLVYNIFVKRDRLLEKKYYEWLADIFKTRKRIEKNKNKEVSPEELAKFMKRAEEYLDRMNKLFDEIREKKFKQDIVSIEKELNKNIRKAIETLGIKKGRRKYLDTFKEELIKEGILSKEYLNSIRYFYKIKQDYKQGKVTSEEIRKARSEINDLISEIRKFIKEKKTNRVEALKIKFKYGRKQGYMWLIGKKVFVIKDVKKPNEIYSAKMTSSGKLTNIKESSREELKKSMKKTTMVEEAFIKEKTFESLRKFFDKDVEFLLGD